MSKCKYHRFEDYAEKENQPGIEGKIATNHMKLYHLVAAKQQPVVVEFGVQKGRATCILLQACEKSGGRLFSVDINDCSDVAESDAWTFILASDMEIEKILGAAPEIAKGIDLLHIDSVPIGEHVSSLLMLWFPYIKPDGYISVATIDETPYKIGRRKANRINEKNTFGLATAFREFFYANEEQLFLEFHFGSIGMGIMKKCSPLGTLPNPAVHLPSFQESLQEATNLWLKALKRRIRLSFMGA